MCALLVIDGVFGTTGRLLYVFLNREEMLYYFHIEYQAYNDPKSKTQRKTPSAVDHVRVVRENVVLPT